MSYLCIPQNTSGKGCVAGGQGVHGQTSQLAEGFGARSYGIPVIKTTAGMQSQFIVKLTANIQGTVASDLIDIDYIQFICRDDSDPNQPLFSVQCQNMGEGLVKFQLTPEQTDYKQGLHFAQFSCYQNTQGSDSSQRKLRKVFKCCLQIQRNIAGKHNDTKQPLTIAQVRMQLYDTCAHVNPLLDDVEFSDVQIVWAINKAVQDWNQMPPDLGQYTAANFPYPSHLCTGAVYHLLKSASFRYVRNQMRHNNANLTLDDNDKGTAYAQLAGQEGQKWDNWCTTKKTQLNMMAMCGSTVDVTFQPVYNDYYRW